MESTQKSEGHFNQDVCLVLQGPLNYYKDIISTYNNFKDNIVISTTDKNEEAINTLNANGFKIVVNDIAIIPGRANFNNQVLTTYSGIEAAKNLGFKYVLKLRSDVLIPKINSLINHLDFKKIYFPAYHLYDGGYLCDYMMFGEIDIMYGFWKIPLSDSKIAPEKQLTQKFDLFYGHLNIDFIFPILYNNDILAYWAKYDKYLNDYKNDSLFVYIKPK